MAIGNNATDVGSIRAGFIVDIADGKRKMAEIKTELTQAADKAKQSSKGMREFGESIKDAAAKKTQLETLGKTLDNVNARIENQRKVLKSLKEAYAATFDDGKKTQLEGKILNVEASLNKLTATSDKTARQMWELEDSFDDVDSAGGKTEKSIAGITSALTALGAGAAAVGLTKTVLTLTDEANQLANALTGVKQVAGALGQDVGKVTKATEQLANRGILSLTEAANAVKTGLATGYGIDETVELINTLTDAAAYNREAHYDWGEAVVVAMNGIKAGNSTLTDAAGITTNLSVMYDQYAKSMGTTADKLTDAGKAQAAYNGMMKEASVFAGNADTAIQGYTGTNNAFKKSIEMARVELGEAFMPTITEIAEKLTPMITKLSDWISENKEFVAGITAAGVSIMGLIAGITATITAITALRYAFVALNASLGPVGLVIAGVTAATVGISAYKVAADMAADSTWKFAESQAELNKRLEESPLNRSVADLKNLQEDYNRLNELLERQAELRAELANLPTIRGGLEITEEMRKISQRSNEVMTELNAVNDALRELGITSQNAESVLDKMRKQIEESTEAQQELRMETLRNIAATEDNAAANEKLANRYAELRKLTNLTADEKSELTEVIRKLTNEYPELHTEMDEQGRLLIVNESLLRDVINAEKDTAAAALTAEVDIKNARIRTAKATVESAKAQIAALQAVASAEKPAWIDGNDFMGDQMRKAAAKAADDKTAKSKQLLAEIGQLEMEVAAIENGTYRSLFSDNKSGGSTAGGLVSPKSGGGSSKSRTAEDIANDAYRAALQQLEMRRTLGKLTTDQEIAEMQRLADKYKEYDAIWLDAEKRRQSLIEQSARTTYEASAEWIDKQTRLMTEAGKSEREIANMQLEAWTRVRNRYAKDTDQYKRADIAMYNARMSLRKEDEKLAKEIADKQKSYANDTLKSIEAAKNTELKALDERKRATKKYYDDLLRMIDDNERGRERSSIEAEAEKYRYATSEQGKRHYAELMEQLRKMDVEDSKQALEDERDARLDAFDEQKADIESWYNELKTAAGEFSGDMIRIYELLEDGRLKAFVDTNTKIKAEMAKFQSDMTSLQSQLPAGVSSGNSSASVIAQMAANSKAWHSADESTRALLSAENQRLGSSIGGTYDSRTGKWTGADGVPMFHTGRNGMTGQTFSVGDRLMPDELTAILRTDEYVFTQGQLRSLLDAKAASGGGQSVHIEKMVGIEIGEATFEDEIDVRAVGRNADDIVASIARNKYVGGGG